MKIKLKNTQEHLYVYAIYWINGERYYYVIPYEGYEGFNAVSENESEVVDNAIGNNFIIEKGFGGVDLLMHAALLEGNLLDSIIEHDPLAMKEFKRRLSGYRQN